MNQNRREVLKASTSLTALGLAVAAGLIKPSEVLAASAASASNYPTKSFAANSLDELMKALGSNMPTESKDIVLTAPDIAENGAEVSLSVDSKLKNISEVAFLVAKNPSILAAQFLIPAGTHSKLTTRVKMNKTSDVYALVKAGGQYYFAKKEVKVTLGGCGA